MNEIGLNNFSLLVLNKEDPDWYWIVRSDGQEGFIPSGFVYPAENILQNQDKSVIPPITNGTVINNNAFPAISPSAINNNNTEELVNQAVADGLAMSRQPQQQQPPSQIIGSDDLRYHGTELVMLYDYKVITEKFL